MVDEQAQITAPGGAHVVVTLESIYTLALETRDTTRDLASRVDSALAGHEDHEGRIRALEARVWKAAGLLGAPGILAGLFQLINAAKG